MPEQDLIRTPAGTGQALEVNGRIVNSAHQQIVAILRSRLGRDHGNLLATPKVEPDGSISWHTPLTGSVVPVAQLADEEQQSILGRAQRLVNDISGLARQMRAEGPAAQFVAQMLDAAVQTPPGQWLYSAGGNPVLAMWGHVLRQTEPSLTIETDQPALSRPLPYEPIVDNAGPLVDGTVRHWLGWVVYALPIGVLMLLLMRYGLTKLADASLAEQIQTVEARNTALAGEIALKRTRVSQCTNEPALAPESRPPGRPSKTTSDK